MAFLQEEIRNFVFKGFSNGILGTANRSTAPDNLTWYEESNTSDISVNARSVLLEIEQIPPARNQTDAHNNTIANPTLLEEYSTTNAIRLTPSPNQKTFFCTSTFGDLTTRLYNFVMPQFTPRIDSGFEGMPSIGYTARLYQGDPNAGGTEITTTVGQQGADVGWIFMYGAGAVVIASSFSSITNPNDLWLTGFRYIGKTAETVVSGLLHTYSQEFTNTDLVGGYLTVSHNLHARYKVCNVTVMNEHSRAIEIDDIYFQTADISILDFRSIEPISGTWSVVITTDVIDTVIPPIINNNRYINGSFINGTQLN